MDDIEALEKALHEALAKQKQEDEDSLAKLPIEYEWHIEWESEHTFYCYKVGTKETIVSYNKWRASHAHAVGTGKLYHIKEKVGMTYLLIGNYLAKVGGGTLVLKSTPDGFDLFDPEPRLITDAERDSLLNGIVPDSLKA